METGALEWRPGSACMPIECGYFNLKDASSMASSVVVTTTMKNPFV
jgi:hypothetical protein